ncbi:hypothetical protein [Sphingomonas sp. EC-HK361]|uniref:hypothetical protein n=1 Tax=Sphingomonas sp. EC-HK361 TaxID=2038397 RepID=UPI00125F9939|nr:hypothetical protein [Sphingomonas sp. EC-HK361]
MSASPRLSTTADIAAMLERFFGRAPGLAPYEWDDFENHTFADARLENWRQRILREVGPHVAPTISSEDAAIANDRATQIIVALKKDEDAQD